MNTELHFPWLELSIMAPLLGAVACMFPRNPLVAQRRATIASALAFFCAVGEWIDFATLNSFSAHDHFDVFSRLFHRDVFVIDELSAPLLPLTALLYLLTIVSTPRTKSRRFSFGLMLLAEALALATLSCREPWTIITLLTAATATPWIELRRRQRSTRIYTLHMGLYLALLWLGWSLVDETTIPNVASPLAIVLLTTAALLRAGVIPLHPWLTDLFEHATFGAALLFVLPMTGAYAVMRLVLPVAPLWATQTIAVLSLVTAVYAAGLALVQTDARRYFCFLFLSNSSLVLTGLEVVNPIGMTGALCVWLSVGLSLGGFGLTLRAVEARIGRISLTEFHGLYEHMPRLASLFLLSGLASIGFPGTIGFIGLELLIEGAVEAFPFVGTAIVLATALNGISIVRVYFRIFTGTRHTATVALQMHPAERFSVIVLTLLVIGGGLWPQVSVHSRYHAVAELLNLPSTSLGDRPTEKAIPHKQGTPKMLHPNVR